MTSFMEGERRRGFVVLLDDEGVRHAIPVRAIQAVWDGDEARQSTWIRVGVSAPVLVHVSLETVLGWLDP